MSMVVLTSVRHLKQGLAEANSLAVCMKEPELEVLQGWRNCRGVSYFYSVEDRNGTATVQTHCFSQVQQVNLRQSARKEEIFK